MAARAGESAAFRRARRPCEGASQSCGAGLPARRLGHRPAAWRSSVGRTAHCARGLPGWTWDPHGEDWQEAIAHLRAYSEREGHARVPRAHVEDGFPLGHWVNTRRAWHRRGRLSAARQRELERVPGWVWDPFEHDWLEGLSRLREYVVREGHALVPAAHIESGFRLGAWVRQRRTEQREGRLAADRVGMLTSLPDWTPDPRELKFQRGVQGLRAFSNATGHARVPATYIAEDGFRLGNWVVNQRAGVPARQTLPPERVRHSRALPGGVGG